MASKLCQCGSQLQLKECCISETVAALKNDYINKLFMPERIAWAIEYIKYKAALNEYVITEHEKHVESIGKKITCQKGCSACCVEFIVARLEECDAIAIYLYLYPELMNHFLKNYDAWYNHISSDDNILEKASDAYQTALETRQPEDKKVFESMALQYAGKGVHCPFLKDDLCTIYPIRPYTCSTYAVISEKHYCKPGLTEQEYVQHKLKVKSEKNPLYYEDKYNDLEYYLDLNGSFTFGPMPTLIYQILQYGPVF